MKTPTDEELIREIENGPLNETLTPYRKDTFDPHPTMREKLRYREGRLKSDAAFAIHKILLEHGRLAELEWDITWKDVLRAYSRKQRKKESK